MTKTVTLEKTFTNFLQNRKENLKLSIFCFNQYDHLTTEFLLIMILDSKILNILIKIFGSNDEIITVCYSI